MPVIYHVTTAAEWELAKEKGAYEAASLKEEGFIHCSQEHQLQGVLDRYFKGKTELVKLVIETDHLSSKFVFDWSAGTQDTFPHIYGPLNLNAVTDVIRL